VLSRAVRWIAALTLALTLAGGGTAIAATGADNLMSIESQFICTSCHEPLELVSSPQALSEKQYLEGLVQKGLTMTEIKAGMVNQYGVAVLAKPPAHGFNLTVYILPPVILIGGLLLLGFTLPKWRARSRLAAVTPLTGAGALSDDETARLNDELDRFI
jgi:cytochrome c-type biogenesis protein CcmH/NrfF